jgi:hypothetical protein
LSDKKGHQVIHDVELDYPVELELINRRVLDYPPIPSHADGKQLPKAFFKWYLEKRIKEWLAAGGHIQWKRNFQYFIKYSEHPASGGRLFLKAFYWDLWKDLKNLCATKVRQSTCSLKGRSSCCVLQRAEGIARVPLEQGYVQVYTQN